MEPAKNQQPQQTQPPPRETSLHFLDYWRIIRIRKTVIVLVFLLVAITATLVTFMLPEMYSSTASIEINPDITDIPNMTGSMGTYASYDPYYIQTEFEIMQSEKVLGRVIRALDLNNVWGKKYNNNVPLKTEDTMQLLKGRMSLSPERNTKLIDITVFGEDPNEAAILANSIAQAYHDYRLDLRSTNTVNGITVLEQEFQAQQDKIETIQSNVDQLRVDLGIVDTDPNSIAPTPTINQDRLAHYKDEQIEEEKTYTKESVQLGELQSMQATNPSELRDVLPTIDSDSALGDLLSKLRTTEQSLAAEKVDYSTNYPDVQRLQKLDDELNSEIDARVQGVMAGLASQVISTKASLDEMTAFLDTTITKDQREYEHDQPYWEKKRELGDMLEFHKILAAKITSEKIDLELPKTTMVTIINEAQPGKSPVKPNKTLNIALGVVIGLLVGIGLAFFIEYLDTSVKTIDDVERAFQAPVLGVIPQNVGRLIDEGMEGQHAEAYRVLRTNLLFTRKDDRLNSIVVVSAGAGEGKSTTVLNLSTVIAQSGQRVLMVDSDLRRPTLHKQLKLSNNIGLTNYLLKQNTLEEVIQRTSIPTLDFMASGKLPSSSMNILGSAQMKNMVSELKQRYDFVVFDSPPIMGVSDAAILASETDMVIQVIQYRRYPQPMNIRAKMLIDKVGGNLVGIILNNINMSQDESYYYYYYGGDYHGYYYSKNEEEGQETPAAEKGPDSNADQSGIKHKY
jgi:capsular exopolysaccharide synthesis family protein